MPAGLKPWALAQGAVHYPLQKAGCYLREMKVSAHQVGVLSKMFLGDELCQYFVE